MRRVGRPLLPAIKRREGGLRFEGCCWSSPGRHCAVAWGEGRATRQYLCISKKRTALRCAAGACNLIDVGNWLRKNYASCNNLLSTHLAFGMHKKQEQGSCHASRAGWFHHQRRHAPAGLVTCALGGSDQERSPACGPAEIPSVTTVRVSSTADRDCC